MDKQKQEGSAPSQNQQINIENLGGAAQFGNNNTQNINVAPSRPQLIIEGLKKLLKYWKYWPYLVSALAVFGGVRVAVEFLLNWVVPGLLWASATANVWLIQRAIVNHRREKKLAQNEAEETRLRFEGLSDEACELIVAAILRNASAIIFDSSGALLLEDTNEVFESDLAAARFSEVLENAVQLGYLKISQKDKNRYELSELANKEANRLLDKDNFRIANTASEIVSGIFREMKSPEYFLTFSKKISEKSCSVVVLCKKPFHLSCLIAYVPFHESEYVYQKYLLKNRLFKEDGFDEIYGKRFILTDRGERVRQLISHLFFRRV